MSKRADWVHANYSLESEGEVWVARGPYFLEYRSDRAALVREVRARFGHFNFRDEAEAFNAVFPRS